ncbi:MAG: AMP-binding protein [Pseudomonadota bacterium]|nr:AMP-binding protein [Pseudomonadota bacterium]
MLYAHYLDRGAELNPDGPCIAEKDKTWSYTEVQAFTYRFANKLDALGFGPGKHGAILATNSALAFKCVLGFHRAGLTYIPANSKSGLDETHYALDQFDCDVLVFESQYVDRVRELKKLLPRLQLLVCLDQDFDDFPSVQTWLADAPEDPFAVYQDRDALAMLMPTGGTTGRSKGVMLTQRNLHNLIGTYMSCFSYRATERPVVMVAAPITHAAGPMAMPTLGRGGLVVILPGPDVALMLDTIEKFHVTEFFLPPTVVYRMLDFPGIESRDFSSLKYFSYAAAPMSLDKLKRALKIFGPCMTQFFGQTEAPAVCTFLAPDEHWSGDDIASDEVLTSCGFPTPMIELEILDENNQIMSRGEQGEVCVRGDLVMAGYYKDPRTTAETIVDGWLHTGDIGWLDSGGRLHLCDRKKDMIISGGLNVYPQEVEQVIWSHSAVQDCAVIGIPDEEWGELITAVIELNPGEDLTADEVIALCKSKLGSVKCPKRVDFIDTLPRSAAGKVLKRELRAKYWADKDRMIN